MKKQKNKASNKKTAKKKKTPVKKKLLRNAAAPTAKVVRSLVDMIHGQ